MMVLILLLVPVSTASDVHPPVPALAAAGTFARFKAAHSRVYSGAAEERKRFEAFRANLDIIAASNARIPGFALGVGEFADLSPAEFMATYTSPSPPSAAATSGPGYLGEHRAARQGPRFPAELDWVARNAVTSVKKQRCGNCWTFSAAGSLEGAWALAGHPLTNFSEQEFVDCCDTGCKGGWNFNALKFAVNHTVCTLESFPCTGTGNGTQCQSWEASPCAAEQGALRKGELSGWKSVGAAKWGHTTEQDLMSSLQLGPVSINMFADSHMAHYKGGVLSYSNCSEGTNHGERCMRRRSTS
jgi:hypothetical protein